MYVHVDSKLVHVLLQAVSVLEQLIEAIIATTEGPPDSITMDTAHSSQQVGGK